MNSNCLYEKILGKGFLAGLREAVLDSEAASESEVEAKWPLLLESLGCKEDYINSTSRINARLEVYGVLESCFPVLRKKEFPLVHSCVLDGSGILVDVGGSLELADTLTGVLHIWTCVRRAIGKNGGVLFTLQNEKGEIRNNEFID